MSGVYKFKHRSLLQIEKIFGEPHAGLLEGFIFGERKFSDDWNERFRRTGTSHIVAASGYNVSLVSSLIFFLLIGIGLWRKQAFPLVFVGILVYAVLAGLDAPIIRASIMGILVLLSRQIGRKTTITNILLLTIFVMLLHEPRILFDDIGFQLSITSTIALIYIAKPMDEIISFIPEKFGIRESLSATLVATLATLPITLLSFSTVSTIAPIANLLVLPLVPYAMLFGGFAIITSFVNYWIAFIFIAITWFFVELILIIIRSLSSLSLAFIELPQIVSFFVVLLASTAIIFLWKKR